MLILQIGNVREDSIYTVLLIIHLLHAERADADSKSYWFETADYQKFPFDPPLTAKGFEDTKQVGWHFFSIAPFNLIISSPYERCLQTTESILLNMPPCTKVIIDDSFGEIYGEPYMSDTEKKGLGPKRRQFHEILNKLPEDIKKRLIFKHNFGFHPKWPETLCQGRLRFAKRFETYVELALLVSNKTNYSLRCLFVSHGDCVASIGCLMSRGKNSLRHIDYLGHICCATECTTHKMQEIIKAKKIVNSSVLLDSDWTINLYNIKND